MACGCFHAAAAELGRCHMASKPKIFAVRQPLLQPRADVLWVFNAMFYFLRTQVSNSPCVFLERQRCALWIRKLCEPSGTGAGVTGRRNRNLYAKLLLHMLRRGALEGPFTHRPEPGTLKTLPSYMVGVFDQKMR